MMYKKSSLRKNYLLNNQTNTITQRKQQSDSNSHSKSIDSNNKKSPNNSFQKIKKDQFKKRQSNLNQFQHTLNTFNRNNANYQVKLRSYSINNHNSSSTTPNSSTNPFLNKIPIQDKNSSMKKQQNVNLAAYKNNLVKKNSQQIQQVFKQPLKLNKFQSQGSQISTQPCSMVNNFMIEDQRPGFVRFSECLIDTKNINNTKSKSKRKQSVSILKKKKNAISCSKIDSSVNIFPYNFSIQNSATKTSNKNKSASTQSVINTNKHYKTSDNDLQKDLENVIIEKYKDQLFPANMQSMFFNKNKIQQIKQKYLADGEVENVEIGWKRLSEVFHNHKITLYKPNSSQKIIKTDHSISSPDFILSLNAIKNVSQFFSKVFQPSSGQYQKHGIYCLKIFQQSVWKSIIIDDNIPVIEIKYKSRKERICKALFVDIEEVKNGQQIEVWPFLLEKAYASYYNSYEALNQNFKIIDWLQQILMAPSQCCYFPDNQQLSEQVIKKLQKNIYQFPSSQSIIIGFNIKTKQPCIIQKKNSPNTNSNNKQVLIKTLKSQRKSKIKHLLQIVHRFYLFLPFHFKYFNSSGINLAKTGKKTLVQHPLTRIKYRDQILIRTFNLQSQGPVSVSIRQKQKRFYVRNAKKYQYLWNRIILVQKQFGNGYRWIDGKYSNQKSINFNMYLEKGQYQIIIMTQLQPEQQMHDLTMIVLSNSQIGIQKKMYEQGNRLLQTACFDIAQRKGQFKQINDSICSYSMIQKSTGLIIENVNNQKSQGGVAISRSIAGLKAKVQIYPFNLDFCINQYQSNFHKRKYKKTVDLLIDPNTHFTIVLMMKGGIDQKFFKVFKFNT